MGVSRKTTFSLEISAPFTPKHPHAKGLVVGCGWEKMEAGPNRRQLGNWGGVILKEILELRSFS